MSSAAAQPWEYRSLGETASVPRWPPSAQGEAPAPSEKPEPVPASPLFTEQQVAARLHAAVAQAQAAAQREAEGAAEQRWAARTATQEARRDQQIEAALEGFTAERARYFRAAETEVVHLALAVARKILGREAALDPELLLALVRVALDRMEIEPAIQLRVAPAELARWQHGTTFAHTRYRCDFVADPALSPGECTVETSLGTAAFGVESQFKAVEQGLLDLLELRPPLPIDRPAPPITTPTAAAAPGLDDSSPAVAASSG